MQIVIYNRLGRVVLCSMLCLSTSHSQTRQNKADCRGLISNKFPQEVDASRRVEFPSLIGFQSQACDPLHSVVILGGIYCTSSPLFNGGGKLGARCAGNPL